MKKTWFISIRSKILFVLSAVLVSAVGLYLYLASQLFFEDKKLLVYELNQTSVRSLGQEVETYFKRVTDKLQVIASMHARDPQTLQALLPQLLTEDEGYLRVGLLDSAGRNEIVGTWPQSLELDGQDASYLDRVRAEHPVPFARVIDKGLWIRNTTARPSPEKGGESPAVVTVAARTRADQLVYADLKLDSLLLSFSNNGLAHTYLMDSDGFTLADSDPARRAQAASLDKDTLMSAARASKVRSELKSYTEDGVEYLGSFFRLGAADLVVGSKTQAGEAFAAAQVLMRKSLLYALLVVTVAFLIALFLSHSITVPIRRMVDATEHIAHGDFTVQLPAKSGDELALLSKSFNAMTDDLRVSREQIQEYSRDLEKKVADRTQKLEEQNVAIKEAQEALVRTTRLASVGEIAGRAAHEVLNPLTNISTRIERIQNQLKSEENADLNLLSEIVGAWKKDFTQGGMDGWVKSLSAPSTAHAGKTLLAEDLDNLDALIHDFNQRRARRLEDLDFLMKESMRINKIVNGMRQLTRVSGNKKAIDAHQVIQESISTMADILSKNKIAVETSFCEGAPRIKSDPDEMLQVFSNLIRNSMQALQESKTPGGKIAFSTAIEGQKLQIRVADNGPGIRDEFLPRIFEADFTTKSIEDGTGLGLAICRRFIRAYGGEISVEKSSPGTTFLIELPLAGAQTQEGVA